MSHEETRRALELERYFCVVPAFRGIYHDINYTYPQLLSASVNNPYVSADEQFLSVQAIKDFFNKSGLLTTPIEEVEQRYWPGDKEEKIR